MELSTLSKAAQDILAFLLSEEQLIYIPKRTVQDQWSPESKGAIEELLEAGIVEEVITYRLVKR